MAIEKWGKKDRIAKCLNTLQTFGAAAKPMLPRLEQLEKELSNHREARNLQKEIDLVRQTINAIKADKDPPVLRSLNGTV